MKHYFIEKNDSTRALNVGSILGTWRLVTFVHEVLKSHEKKNIMGENPNGFIIFTPEGRVYVIITGENRPSLHTEGVLSDSLKLALYDSLMAYSGTYTLEGNNHCTFNIDIAWNKSWEGTILNRVYKLSGNKLEIDLLPQIGIDGNWATAKLTWIRE
jgi:Lipocalin-like domain